MSSIKYIESLKSELYDINRIPGQIINSIDTNETFFDTIEMSRIILDNIIYLDKDTDKDSVSVPLLNKIYIAKDTKIVYRYDTKWCAIQDINSILCTNLHSNQLRPVTVMKGENNIAPRTLSSVVYDDTTGESLNVQIEATNKLTLCKVKSVYVEALTDKQKLFKIPYPISDYDFRKNFMTVIIDGDILSETKFTIRDDDYLVLNDDQIGLDIGKLVLFIFYYNVYIDINDGVLLSTKNLRDRCVTEPKLADNAVSTRTVMSKSITEPKLADDSVNNRVIANSSIKTENLDLLNIALPAINVTESEARVFITAQQKTELIKVLNNPKLIVSATAPVEFGVKDVWVDITEFIFKVRSGDTWKPMGAVYN